jgi:ADP-ribosylglycohydrolase
MKNKIRGMFLGIGIGDALGICCEGWTAEKIKTVYGRITDYQYPKGHKYNDGKKAGSWSDDTAATIAVARSLIESGRLDMESQVKHHIEAFKNHEGWGKATRQSIHKLMNGTSWRESGSDKGTGNGIAMKITPLGAWWHPSREENGQVSIPDFTAMTHRTSIAVSSAFAHMNAISYCLTYNDFKNSEFVNWVVGGSESGKKYFQDTLKDNITEKFMKLYGVDKSWTPEQIIEEFDGGYAVHKSLPFTYAFFLRNPRSIESLFDCVNSGGDTDSNGSMLGGLLGVLNGEELFPQYLVDGLDRKDEILNLANEFSDKFYHE